MTKHGSFANQRLRRSEAVLYSSSIIYFQGICLVCVLYCDGTRQYAEDCASSDYRSKQLARAPVPFLHAEELSMLFHMQLMIPEGKCLNRKRRSGRWMHPFCLRCVNTSLAVLLYCVSNSPDWREWTELSIMFICSWSLICVPLGKLSLATKEWWNSSRFSAL